jgi:hypothetical protein
VPHSGTTVKARLLRGYGMMAWSWSNAGALDAGEVVGHILFRQR